MCRVCIHTSAHVSRCTCLRWFGSSFSYPNQLFLGSWFGFILNLIWIFLWLGTLWISSVSIHFDPFCGWQMSFSRVYSGLHWSSLITAGAGRGTAKMESWADKGGRQLSVLVQFSSGDVRTVHREPAKPFAKPWERRDEMCAEFAVVQKWVQNLIKDWGDFPSWPQRRSDALYVF